MLLKSVYPVHGMVPSVVGLTKCMKFWSTLLQETFAPVSESTSKAAKSDSGSDWLYLSNMASYPPAALIPACKKGIHFCTELSSLQRMVNFSQ